MRWLRKWLESNRVQLPSEITLESSFEVKGYGVYELTGHVEADSAIELLLSGVVYLKGNIEEIATFESIPAGIMRFQADISTGDEWTAKVGSDELVVEIQSCLSMTSRGTLLAGLGWDEAMELSIHSNLTDGSFQAPDEATVISFPMMGVMGIN